MPLSEVKRRERRGAYIKLYTFKSSIGNGWRSGVEFRDIGPGLAYSPREKAWSSAARLARLAVTSMVEDLGGTVTWPEPEPEPEPAPAPAE